MNKLLEIYVDNIIYEERVKEVDFILYKLIADTYCYGYKEYNKEFFLTEADYNSVKTKGYYYG